MEWNQDRRLTVRVERNKIQYLVNGAVKKEKVVLLRGREAGPLGGGVAGGVVEGGEEEGCSLVLL